MHNLGTKVGWVVDATPQPLYTWKRFPVPLVQEAWWTSGLAWTGMENLTSTLQPVVIHYTNYTILSALLEYGLHINNHNETISKQCVNEHLCLTTELMCRYIEIFAFSIPCIAIQLL
jgi:hypothetical protein